MFIFNKSRKQKVYYFLSKIERINKGKIKTILIGSATLLFLDRIQNPTDLDILLPNETSFRTLFNQDTFKELSKDKKIQLNKSKNPNLTNYVYTMKYCGLHIDIYIGRVFDINYNIIYQFSKRTKINDNLEILTPNYEMLFILKAIKIPIKEEYKRIKGDRYIIRDIKQIIFIKYKLEEDLLKKIINKLPEHIKIKVLEIINLINSDREDINRMKRDVVKKFF